MMPPKRIYIADDDDNIREAIRAFLENDGYVVTGFPDGEALLSRFAQEPADLVILDIMMPGPDGFTVCSRIREQSTVPIIMLTARDSDLDYVRGISLGSDDYFTKPFSPTALVMRVKAIFRRIEFERQQQSTAAGEKLRCGGVTIDRKAKSVRAGVRSLDLTPNEYDVLCYLMARPGQAVSRDELLREVWGCEAEIETRATDDTVRRLRKKLDGSGLAIEAVWGFGFRLKEGEKA